MRKLILLPWFHTAKYFEYRHFSVKEVSSTERIKFTLLGIKKYNRKTEKVPFAYTMMLYGGYSTFKGRFVQ